MKDFRFYFETVGTYPTKVPCGSPATLFYPSFAVKPQLVNYLSPRQSRGSRLVANKWSEFFLQLENLCQMAQHNFKGLLWKKA